MEVWSEVRLGGIIRGLVRWLACLTVLAVLAGCSQPQVNKKALSKVRIAYPSIIHSLDPLSENTLISGSIYGNIFETLVRQDAEFRFQPALSVRWSTPNDRTWIFALRRDVTFHDGTPFTAEDVVFTFDRIKASSVAQQSSSVTVIDKMEAVDTYTIKLTTHQFCGNLLSRLSGQSIVSKKFFNSGATGFIPGTGPYRVRDWAPGKEVDLVVYENYWGNKPAIKEVSFEANATVDESVQKLLKGELEVLPQLDPAAVKKYQFASHQDVVVRNYPGVLVLYLSFDTMHETLPGLSTNPFKDSRVRKAVYEAVNVDFLIHDIQQGYATEATQLIVPLVYGYNQETHRLPYDPAKSRRLLAEAGYPNGFAVRLDLPNNRYRSEVQVGQAIAKDLEAIGIHVELNPQPREEWTRIRQEGQSAFYLAGWAVASGDASGALDYLIHTPDIASGYGRANSGGYSNAEIDRIIEESGREPDPKERQELMERAMALAMEDVAGVPLYIEQNLTAYRSSLQWDPRADLVILCSDMQPAP
jgi:peptide/nickel transport system substrate-binding protein